MLDETDKDGANTDASKVRDAADSSPRSSKPARRPRRTARRPAGPSVAFSAPGSDATLDSGEREPTSKKTKGGPDNKSDDASPKARPATTSAPLFQPPPTVPALPKSERKSLTKGDGEASEEQEPGTQQNRKRKKSGGKNESESAGSKGKSDGERSGRGKKNAGAEETPDSEDQSQSERSADGDDDGSGKRRRRRRRRDEDGGKSRKRGGNDEVTSIKGSTRIEAKRQRRREGRESGRRRAPVLSEAEFLARRESVERTMFVRERGRVTQIAVLEDDVLVEHYVNRATASSQVGNVYLGRVQNVLPSMEAAFVDVGRGRNAVLYAGEVNWDAAGLEGQAKRIEKALSSGDKVLVQVTKDPVGHKGARLTSQISLPGRFVVLVPDGSMTGISRKLPDRERTRLRRILKEIVPKGFGVIVRTAAEGAEEEDLKRDVAMLNRNWEKIQKRAKTARAPSLLHTEPDLALRIARDVFNSDFKSMVVSGDKTWTTLKTYVDDNAPGLSERVSHWTTDEDLFAANRIDEQLSKALDRKVWLPSGGSLVIDRTEAMTVVDVNTGRFTGQGGNLEETVTKNNLEAAEEVVRQLRLRDVGGIIVIDFIDMVLESNRDLVVRRLVECLGRDRTKHQVAEVTSLGLVQMTRKRLGQGLVETFSEPCECCNGRGEKVQLELSDQRPAERRARSTPPPGAHDPAELAARMANGSQDQSADDNASDDSESDADSLDGSAVDDDGLVAVDGDVDVESSSDVSGDAEGQADEASGDTAEHDDETATDSKAADPDGSWDSGEEPDPESEFDHGPQNP